MNAPEIEHEFFDGGYDIWGYDRGGHYDSRFDLAPFQKSPFPTCPQCDNCEPCDKDVTK